MPKKRLTPDKFNPKTDILTIPNAMSALGAISTWHGAKEIDTPCGLAQVVAGRLLDVADGPVARKTGQTSNFGAIVDAGLDKVVTTKIIYEMWRNNIAPKQVLGTIALLSAVNTAATIKTATKVANETVRPERAGKFALALETAALFAFATGRVLENRGEPGAKIARNIGNAAFLAALPLAAKSTWDYVNRALGEKNPRN